MTAPNPRQSHGAYEIQFVDERGEKIRVPLHECSPVSSDSSGARVHKKGVGAGSHSNVTPGDVPPGVNAQASGWPSHDMAGPPPERPSFSGAYGSHDSHFLQEALALPVDDAVWTRRDRFDPAAVRIADRHYSREKVGSPQVGGPGFLLVFVTPDELAAWISKRHANEAFAAGRNRATADGFRGYRCALFRNESSHLASDLIREAVTLTERLWGPSPFGWMTYVDRSKIASRNPGYCFKRAGWVLDRDFVHPHLVRLTLPPVAIEAVA